MVAAATWTTARSGAMGPARAAWAPVPRVTNVANPLVEVAELEAPVLILEWGAEA
jgi:hypothetical protein